MTGNCSNCLMTYTEDGPKQYWAKEKCRSCYMNDYYKRERRKNKTEYGDSCVNCSLKFGSTNSKGHIVKESSRGYCHTCYGRLYRKNINYVCISCGCNMSRGSSKKKCSACRKKIKMKLVDRTTCEKIRLLLARYKRRLNSPVDDLILCDIYMTLHDENIQKWGLERYKKEDQVVMMLRSLKEFYDYSIVAYTFM